LKPRQLRRKPIEAREEFRGLGARASLKRASFRSSAEWRTE